MTANEVAAAYRVPTGTVYRLASVLRWRRTHDGRRPVLYNADDVDAALGASLDAVTSGEA
jgi:hypothetical protein